MKNCITQYKLLFCLSWIALYLLFPSWISKHLFFQDHGFPNISYPLARSLVIFSLVIYFSAAAYLMTRWFNALSLSKPLIIGITDWSRHIKNNMGLVIVCCLSAVLHLYTSSPLIVLNEVRPLDRTMWMNDILNEHWHRLLDVPIQYFFWSLLVLLILLIKQKKMINSISIYISEGVSAYKSNYLITFLYIFFIFILFTIYSYSFPYYSYGEALWVVRYPPVSSILYLITYSAFGTSYIGPRLLQFVFYILSAVYLYRTIKLFRDKETALLGAAICLFSPIIFSYASMANLAPGTLFFVILISYYFLRFIKNSDDRDLILASYFIGFGFLYKKSIILMFVICFTYLALSRVIKRDWNSLIHFKILLLSLFVILPWLKLAPSGVYDPVWSNFITPREIIAFLLMVKSQLSSVICFLFVLALIIGVYTKRDDLTFFHAFLFIAYYLFFTLMEDGELNHRYAIILYPAIAVLLAQFIIGFTQKIRWRHTYKIVCSVLIIYLIFISVIPRSSSDLTTWRYRDFETQYFPIDKVTEWVKNRTEVNANILVLYMNDPYIYYLKEIYSDKDIANQRNFIFLDLGQGVKKFVYPLQNLKRYCQENNISYIMFPFSPNNSTLPANTFIEKAAMTKYLHDNMNNEFKQIVKFDIEDNYIFIYKTI